MAGQTQKNQQKNSPLRRPGVRVGLVISLLVIICASLTLLFFAANRSLFSKNPHFILRHLDVRSSGFWSTNQGELLKRLGLKLDVSNLFDFTLSDAVGKLRAEPGIEKVSVSRTLPDTLCLEISERIPRAFIKSNNSGWVADSSSILLDAKRMPPIKGSIPIITGLRIQRRIAVGETISEIQDAMRIIMESVTRYPEMKISMINIAVPREMHIYFTYKSNKNETVAILPCDSIEEKLGAIAMFYENNPDEDAEGLTLDLRFKNMLVKQNAELE